jgi:hypothetical protein
MKETQSTRAIKKKLKIVIFKPTVTAEAIQLDHFSSKVSLTACSTPNIIFLKKLDLEEERMKKKPPLLKEK